MILFNYLGDEDRARGYTHEAEKLAAAGRSGAQMSDGTTIEIFGPPEQQIAYIHSPFLPEYVVLAPRAAEGGGYYLELYGYNHRKDAMLPSGTHRAVMDFSGVGYDDMIGVEVAYVSDGITANIYLFDSSADDDTMRDPKTYIVAFGLSGVTEDLQTNADYVYTPQGFPVTLVGIEASASYLSQGAYLASLTPYGVDRAGADPVYYMVVGVNYEAPQSMIVETYNSGNSDVQYKLVTVGFVFASIGRSSAFDYALYSLTTGVLRYDDPGGMISSQFPVMVPLGNNRAVAFFKRRTVNAAYLFGGEFSLGATLVSGTTFTQTILSTASITSGWFALSTWNHGTSASTTLVHSSDTVKTNVLLESMANATHAAIPLGQDETLIIGQKIYVGYDEALSDWSTATAPWSAQQMCYSVTPTGVGPKGAVVSYFDEYYDGSYPGIGGNTNIFTYSLVGALDLGNDVVVAFFHRHVAAFDIAPQFRYDGLIRFTSQDAGATWDAGVTSYMNWGTDGPPQQWLLSPPKLIGFTATGGAVILLGVTFASTVVGGAELTDTTMFTSDDSGTTFALAPIGTVDLAYLLPTGATIFHRHRGITSVQTWGNHEDGFSPSSHPLQPAYYGTATKACRDTSTDPNL